MYMSLVAGQYRGSDLPEAIVTSGRKQRSRRGRFRSLVKEAIQIVGSSSWWAMLIQARDRNICRVEG